VARRLPALRFHPATIDRWPDVERLFGERGACAGCWCMFWRRARKDWEAGKGEGNRRELRKLVRNGAEPGVLAYHGAEPIGWCAVAPRTDYPALARSRVLGPLDDRPVWSIACLFVARPHRRCGVSARLLGAAVDHARSRGATIVEGYPTIPGSKRAPDAFLWTGTASAFERAGFREVLRRSPTRPIVRRTTRRAK
jgi:GNAT superfamily N-acetyltransferase